MSGAVAAIMLASRGADINVVHEYDAGAGTETVPVGSHQVVIRVWAAGGNGGNSYSAGNYGGGGGASGSYALKTVPLFPADWGKTLSYAVGAAPGGTSTVTNSTLAAAVAISCLGGGNGAAANISGVGAGGAGQAASGGDTNTAGNAGNAGSTSGLGGGGAGAPNGGSSSSGPGTTPGGGGGGATVGGDPAQPGAAGRVRFSYT